jgi:hypothetical protein
MNEGLSFSLVHAQESTSMATSVKYGRDLPVPAGVKAAVNRAAWF